MSISGSVMGMTGRPGTLDIDVLEIRPGSGIDYERAVDAVYQFLYNDISRPRDYLKKVPVIIYPGVTLPIGAQRLLEQNFGGMRNYKPV